MWLLCLDSAVETREELGTCILEMGTHCSFPARDSLRLSPFLLQPPSTALSLVALRQETPWDLITSHALGKTAACPLALSPWVTSLPWGCWEQQLASQSGPSGCSDLPDAPGLPVSQPQPSFFHSQPPHSCLLPCSVRAPWPAD